MTAVTAPTSRRIKLMADYGCFPLWNVGGGDVGNIDPDTLPLSASLRSALGAWAAAFDATLNEDDPLASGFATDDDAAAFACEGERLLSRLRDELGAGVDVVYAPP